MERQWPDVSLHEYYRRVTNVKPPVESFIVSKFQHIDLKMIGDMLADYDSFSVQLDKAEVPAYEYLLYLRHHGFPSPLLDWSRSPFIAAYFAFAHSPPKGGSERVAIFAYAERPLGMKVRTGGDPGIHALSPHVSGHRRHFLQKSEYTVCLRWRENSWQFAPHDEVLSGGQAMQDILRKFALPASERLKVLSHLGRYNLNGYSLFGSEESLMETMALRETIRAEQNARNFIDLSKTEPSAGAAPTSV
jgi:FRG domain